MENQSFESWFNGSVITKDGQPGGEPLIVYHGTRAKFTEFKPGTSVGNQGETDQIPGIYFTDNRDGASFYALDENDPRFMKEVFLAIKKPYVVDSKAKLKRSLGLGKLEDVTKRLKNFGYDGIVINNGFYSFGGPNREIIAFDPGQVRLVSDCNNPSSPMAGAGARINTTPPEDESLYVPIKETDRWLWEQYYDRESGQLKASTRTTRAAPYPWSVGTWRIDHMKLGYGRMIEQLREIPVQDIEIAEEDYTNPKNNNEGRGDDARRYARWIREGTTPPPISVLETDSGALRVVDGHRRLAAMKMAKEKSIRAWVSPRMETGKYTPEGFPIYVALTYERGAVKKDGEQKTKRTKRSVSCPGWQRG